MTLPPLVRRVWRRLARLRRQATAPLTGKHPDGTIEALDKDLRTILDYFRG